MVNKKGECKKLKPIWIGPLLVTQVLSPVLYKVKDRHREHVLHHDRLKLCEDHVVPMWFCQLRHRVVDLDATVAYDETEQELYGDSPVMPMPSSRVGVLRRVLLCILMVLVSW